MNITRDSLHRRILNRTQVSDQLRTLEIGSFIISESSLDVKRYVVVIKLWMALANFANVELETYKSLCIWEVPTGGSSFDDVLGVLCLIRCIGVWMEIQLCIKTDIGGQRRP